MRNHTRLLAALALAAALAAPLRATAANANASFTVTASVAPLCTIAAAPLTFATNYDPNAGSPNTASSTVTLTCTKNTAYSVVLNSASGYKMTDGTDTLGYQLFRADGTTAWDATHPLAGVAGSRSAIPLVVRGSIPAGQDVETGTYTDTVVAVVTF